VRTKQRTLEIALKEASLGMTGAYDFEGEDGLNDRDIEMLARIAIETIDRWEKQHANKA